MSAKRAPTRAHIQPFCFPSTSRGTRTRTPNRAAHFECAMSTLFHQTGIVKRSTVFYGALVPPVGLEPTRPTERHILSVVCLPIPPRRPKKKGAETNTRDNHATTVRPTGQPNPRARTLSTGPPRPAPTYSPTPRASWRKHPSATRTHQAHHQCHHTPQRDSTRSRAVPPCCFRSPVGVAGLEPTTSPSRRGRSTKLSHTPKTGKQTLKTSTI